MLNIFRAKRAGFAMYLILGLLALSLVGFGVSGNGFGGPPSVASVGDQHISAQQYYNALNARINQLASITGNRMTGTQARTSGLANNVLEQLLEEAGLRHAADEQRISLSDASVAQLLAQIEPFQDAEGKFNKDAYEFALDNANLSAAEFEENVREEAISSLMRSALTAPLTPAPALTDNLFAYFNETRDIRWFALPYSDMKLPEAPEDSVLQSYMEQHESVFTRPEQRALSYIALTPEMLIDAMEISEAEIKAAYDAAADRFQTPEKRELLRLGFSDEDAARAALEAIKKGEINLLALAGIRDLGEEDINIGEVAANELDEAAANALFAANDGVFGPFDSPLGPVLYEIRNAIPASSTPFAEVREELRREIGHPKALDQIDGLLLEIDEKLAAGATLEDVAKETPAQLHQFVAGLDTPDGVTADLAFQQEAQIAKTDGFPAATRLNAGGVFALRLDQLTPAALPPLAEMKSEVLAAWQEDERQKSGAERAEMLAAQLEDGQPLEALAGDAEIHEIAGLARDARQEDTPLGFTSAAFEADKSFWVSGGDAVLVGQVDARHQPAADSADMAERRDQMSAAIADLRSRDTLSYLLRAIRDDGGVTYNHSLMQSVETQLN